MKFINPSVEIWEQDITNPDILVEAMWAHVARCVRVCYQVDKPKNNETEEEYVRRVIFRNPEERLANHYSVLEHGAVYLMIYDDIADKNGRAWHIRHILQNNPYTKYKYHRDYRRWVFSTNLRVLVEHNILDALQYFVPFNPEWHTRRVTVSFITNIGVTREANRHRINSPSEESTRYCNYASKKKGEHINYTVPAWISEGEIWDAIHNKDINSPIGIYLEALSVCEKAYKSLISYGWKPEQAREVLPLATKSQLIHTAFVDDWKDFLKLRADAISGSVHPNMLVVAKPLKEEFINRKYI